MGLPLNGGTYLVIPYLFLKMGISPSAPCFVKSLQIGASGVFWVSGNCSTPNSVWRLS